MKVSRKNKHFPPSQSLDLHLCSLSCSRNEGVLFFILLLFFTNFASSSKVNSHIPHGCDLWSNETEQNSNVKIGCVRCQAR